MTEHKFFFVEHPELAAEATWGRRKKQTKTLRGYQVIHDHQLIGYVSERLTTFESKTPGRRYVNYRWQSPRWFSSKKDHGFGRYYHDSRQLAAESLLIEIKLHHAMQIEEIRDHVETANG